MSVKEIKIRGGLGGADCATLISHDGRRFELQAEPGESAEAFRDRARSRAEAESAEYVVFGGLP
jgi:hypothetical protein